MVVVFASEHDEFAKSLVRRWVDCDAVMLVARDLSSAGWSCTNGDPRNSTWVAGGVQRCASQISGVLIRWPGVSPSELLHITRSDRAFVASEMTAFLVYWLTAIGCPLLNRPTPQSLSGPGWHPEHWVFHAARVGMRVRCVERSVGIESAAAKPGLSDEEPEIDVTIAGGICFGEVAPDLRSKALDLAKLAGVDLVKFRFAMDGTFLDADVCPAFDDKQVEKAVLQHLAGDSNGLR